MSNPTIPERLRRLHRLYLAEGHALAVMDLVDAERLAKRIGRHIHDEHVAVVAAAEGHGFTPEEVTRTQGAFDALRGAARNKVRLQIAQAAFREAEQSGAFVPKSSLVEIRGWLRQAAANAEHEAQQAIRTVLDLFADESTARDNEGE
jgi:hypothetical protein